MRIRFLLAFFFIQLFTIKTALGKDQNKTKSITETPKKIILKDKNFNDHRNKRSLDVNENTFWPNKGKRLHNLRLKNDKERDSKPTNNYVTDKDPPFWGTRGRRDSTSMEDDFDDSSIQSGDAMFYTTNCDHCYKFPVKNNYDGNRNLKDRREEQNIPFWGNRGRRNSEESGISSYPFWKSRGRRQEDDPFWGSRGRRDHEIPFWGNRGRRYSWEKHDDVVQETPFWGNRGRRDEIEPFWGSRGRRQEQEPFWGSRGRRESKNIRKEGLKKVLRDAINTVEDNIESLTRIKRDGSYALSSFWSSRGRDNKLSNSFKLGRHRFQMQSILDDSKPTESNTMQDDRIYAEQPHYILVERSSRSSGEDDPYYISRGKKMLVKDDNERSYASRTRRGSLEELVKSVRHDPYYIARGKKYAPSNSNENSTLSAKELEKAKELICATIDLIQFNKGIKTKREVDDNDRDRRTILKKLAAQLQIDPYFVSRGKKNESFFNQDNLEDFINEVSVKCN